VEFKTILFSAASLSQRIVLLFPYHWCRMACSLVLLLCFWSNFRLNVGTVVKLLTSMIQLPLMSINPCFIILIFVFQVPCACMTLYRSVIFNYGDVSWQYKISAKQILIWKKKIRTIVLQDHLFKTVNLIWLSTFELAISVKECLSAHSKSCPKPFQWAKCIYWRQWALA